MRRARSRRQPARTFFVIFFLLKEQILEVENVREAIHVQFNVAQHDMGLMLDRGGFDGRPDQAPPFLESGLRCGPGTRLQCWIAQDDCEQC